MKRHKRKKNNNTKAQSVVVVGAGMFVCGRGTNEYGTVLPTLIEEQSKGNIKDIWVVATSQKSIEEARKKARATSRRLEVSPRIKYLPKTGKSTSAYKEAFKHVKRPASVIIATPDHIHGRIAKDAIEERLDTLVVKPIAPTFKEAQKLVILLDKHNVYGAVEFHKHWDESNLLLRQMIEDGSLGELRYFSVEYSQRKVMQDMFKKWLKKTNVFQYLGIHYVDLIGFMTGAKPVRVMATAQKGMKSDDAIEAVIEWRMPKIRHTFRSTISTNWIDPNTTSAMSYQRILAVGSRGRCEEDQKNRGVELVTDKGVESINPYFTKIYRGGDGNMGVFGYGPASIRQFLKDTADLREGNVTRKELEKNRPTFARSLASIAVIEAVAKSLREKNKWIAV